MLPITELLILTAIAGVAIPIGGLLASYKHIHSDWLRSEFRHFVIAATIALQTFPKDSTPIESFDKVVCRSRAS